MEIMASLVTFAVLAWMSLWANREFNAYERLPMQWSLSGKVNWSAPRPLALAFTPVLAAFVLLGTYVYAASSLRELLFMALCFVAAHVAHLYFIRKTVLR
jgi:hypothetical protein